MALVAGVDSSTQTCKVTVRDLDSGVVVREGRAAHPSGTVVPPEAWWTALLTAVHRAGGLDGVCAISVAGQQHTPVFLDAEGAVVCDSPLWNDVGSHPHMVALNDELGREEWIKRTGLPLTLSDTVTKLRWLRDERPGAARRTRAVAVVHDWLTWRLTGHGPGSGGLDLLTTDRSEASGTGYWSGDTEDYCHDLVEVAFGRGLHLPRVLGPLDRAGTTGRGLPGVPAGIPVAAGSGDNAAAALSLGLREGDAVMSLGTSGVVYSRAARAVHDYDGYVCSYADATGDHLPIVATMNAARNLHLGAGLLGCSYDELSDLALAAPPGAEGLTVLPYFEGERTPDLPLARGSVHGASLTNFTRANFARAVVEGTVASQAAMLGYLHALDLPTRRLLLIGGAAGSPAVQTVLSQAVDVPLVLPAPDEYVAKGAALQAGGALLGRFPTWPVSSTQLPAQAQEACITEQHRAAKVALGYEAGPGADPRA